MNASLTDFDQNALSTHVAADQGEYHISVDAGPYHLAYADSGPRVPASSSASTSRRGTPRPVYVATSSTRCSTSTSCAHLEPSWPRCPSVTLTYSTA